MPIRLDDRRLKRAAFTMMWDNRISKREVNRLIRSVERGDGMTPTARADLNRLLADVGDKFDADAKERLESYLGINAADAAPPAAGTGDVTTVSQRAASVTDLNQLANTFKQEMQDRSGDFQNPEAAFKLFSEYGGRLKALADGVDPRKVDEAADALLEAGRNSPARGYDDKDTDFDTVSDLAEAARGRDPSTFDVRDEEVGKIWSTTYWPMAGSGGTDQDGSPSSHLWAKQGPLAKIDTLLKSRGMEDQAKALEFERKPALNWLVGDRDKGHMINNANLREDDAEMTTGVDFDGDGKLTPGVKVDFLDADGNLAAVKNRNQLIPKATIDGDVVEVRRERITSDDGDISFKFFNKATGDELSAEELKSVFYANPVSGDGKADKTLNVGWWGSCDKVALAGVLFKEPIKDSVEVDGVKFTKQDMLGLLTVIADSQAMGTDFVGHRYDSKPDILVTKDGRQLYGKFEGKDSAGNKITEDTFRGGDAMWRWDGDYMVLSQPYKDDPERELSFREADGTLTTIKAKDIEHMAREDSKDISPIEFHSTILKWLSEGRAAAMDKDAGDHVWNYSFHGATLQSAKELKGDSRPKDPGHNGKVGDDTRIVEFDMEVRFGNSTVGTDYKYWLEFDNAGKPVNGGWESKNPDFLWRPAGFREFTGPNDRNPFVKPELVKEIYDKFMEQ